MRIMKKREYEEEKILQEFHEMAVYDIKEIQQCFLRAGRLFGTCDKKQDTARKGRDVVESVILKECVGCREKESCRFTIEDKNRLGAVIEKQGGLSLQNFRGCHSCRKEQDFVEETNRIYERELFHNSMEQGMIQMRKMIGEQYEEAGRMLGEFLQGETEISRDNPVLSEKIKKEFRKKQLDVRQIYFFKNNKKERRIYLFLKKKKGKEMTVRQVGEILSGILQKKMQPLSGQKKIIGSRYEMVGFCMAEKFHVLGGVVSEPYRENEINGDSFSMGVIGEKRYVSMISDGMGTGDGAGAQSRQTVEIMEELLEAGISEKQAIRLWQSMFAFYPGKEQYATLDYFQLDLSAGVGSFLKIGACQSFLKRRGKAEMIKMKPIPVGTAGGNELLFYRKKFESEDLLIQMSDGILDSIPGNAEDMVCKIIEEVKAIRPQAFAEELFQKMKDTEGYEKKDDDTIIVLGIWDKY